MMRISRVWSNPVFVVAAVCDNLAYGVIIPVLPAVLLRDPNIPNDDVQGWLSYMLALYGLTLLVFSPIFGYMSDHYWSRRTLLLLGLFIMAVSLVLFMAFSSFPMIIIAARASQGASSAAVGVGGLALILDTVGPKNAAVGVSFSIVSVFLSAAVAPVLGGVLYDNLGYHAVFIFPTGLLGLAMILLLMIRMRPKEIHDNAGTIATSQRGSSMETDHPDLCRSSEQTPLLPPDPSIQGTGTSVIAHQPSSMLDLLKGGRMINAVVTVTICVSVFAAIETTLPLFLLTRFSWSPTQTGLLFLICSVPKAVSPLAGKLVDRYGARYPTAIAVITSACSMMCLCFVQDDSTLHKALLVLYLALNNTAAAVSETAMIAEIGIIAGAENLTAQGGAVVNMALASGLMLGPLLGGFTFGLLGWQGLNVSLGLMWLVCLPGTMMYTLKK